MTRDCKALIFVALGYLAVSTDSCPAYDPQAASFMFGLWLTFGAVVIIELAVSRVVKRSEQRCSAAHRKVKKLEA